LKLNKEIRDYFTDFFVLRITSYQLPKIGSIAFVVVSD